MYSKDRGRRRIRFWWYAERSSNGPCIMVPSVPCKDGSVRYENQPEKTGHKYAVTVRTVLVLYVLVLYGRL